MRDDASQPFLKKDFNRLKKKVQDAYTVTSFLGRDGVVTHPNTNIQKWHEIDEEKPEFCLYSPIDPYFVINFSNNLHLKSIWN